MHSLFQILNYFDYFFTSVFTIEILIKVREINSCCFVFRELVVKPDIKYFALTECLDLLSLWLRTEQFVFFFFLDGSVCLTTFLYWCYFRQQYGMYDLSHFPKFTFACNLSVYSMVVFLISSGLFLAADFFLWFGATQGVVLSECLQSIRLACSRNLSGVFLPRVSIFIPFLLSSVCLDF